MNDAELRGLADTLEASVDGEKPKSHLSLAGPGPVLWMTSDRTGLVRLAALFLRAATEPMLEGKRCSDFVVVEHDQIIKTRADQKLAALQRVDRLDGPDGLTYESQAPRWNDRLVLAGCAIISIVVLFLLTSGIALWWQILAGNQ